MGHHICPSNDVEPFSILHILQCSSKKGLFKIGLHPHGFKFFYRFFGSLWIWPTLWVFKGASQSNPEGAAPWATQSNHTVSNEVEPFLKTTDFTNDLLKIGLSKKMVVPSGIQPLLQFLWLLMTLAHPLGTHRGIPIESRRGHQPGPPIWSVSNDVEPFV